MFTKLMTVCSSGLLFTTTCACSVVPEVESDGAIYDPEQGWNAFRSTVYHEPFENGVFIVEGDVPIPDEERLREYYFTYVAPAGQALTVLRAMGADVIWPSDVKFNLTYCVSDLFGSHKPTVIENMEIAARSWSDRVGLRFSYMPAEDQSCDGTNTNIVFDVRPVDTSAYFARAFFPNYSRAQRNLLIAGAAFTTTAGGRDFQGILRHELGHALGFRHEHIWSTTCAGEPTSDARLLTEYDVNSVMHYPHCRPVDAGGYRQTDHDYEGAVSLYGLAPALIVSTLAFP